MIEKGTSKDLKLIYTPSGENNCWGDDSEIFISYTSSKVTIYHNGIPLAAGSEHKFFKKNVGDGTLTITANTESASWGDIGITVKGTPISNVGSCNNNGSGSTSGHKHNTTAPTTFNVVVYTITMSVQEKPWGGTWGTVEDQGSRSVNGETRQWYHLWKENENAIKANLIPSCLEEVVTDASFGNLGVSEGFIENLPLWKRISDSGLKEGITPTAFVGDVALPGTKAPKIDIMVNDILSIVWVPVDGGANKINLGSNPSDNGGGMRCFPEKDSPNANSVNSQINAKVTLVAPVPTDMWGTVHLAWFDPDNPLGPAAGGGAANTIHDNYGNIKFADPAMSTLTFKTATDTRYQSATMEFSDSSSNYSAHAGDNYIVAVHPNPGAAENYRFKMMVSHWSIRTTTACGRIWRKKSCEPRCSPSGGRFMWSVIPCHFRCLQVCQT